MHSDEIKQTKSDGAIFAVKSTIEQRTERARYTLEGITDNDFVNFESRMKKVKISLAEAEAYYEEWRKLSDKALTETPF